MDFHSWGSELAHWGRSGGRNLALFESVSSTHRVGRRVADRLESPAAWLLALHQTAGYGRFERGWSSPRAAGVYATYLTTIAGDRLPVVPMALGVALCRSLGELGYDCRLEWPNDVTLDGAKLGGILAHGRSTGGRAVVAASFGINRSHQPADLPRDDATSLELASSGGARSRSTPSLVELTCRLASSVEAALDSGTSRERLVEQYGQWSAHRTGELLEVQSGEETVRGALSGFTPEGYLELQTSDGLVRVASGVMQ